MLIAAAVCPHQPLLIPEATGAPGAADPELSRLRTACRDAVAGLASARPDLIVVLAGAAGQDAFDAELRYRGAPFEVNYLVASWRRAH